MDIFVENISKRFGSLTAVNSVSFEVKKGEILGILGPNGAGKTTIMKILACYLQPDSGNVYIGHHAVGKNNTKIKEHIGYLSENNPLYQSINVIDFLKFVAAIHNIPRYKVPVRVMEMIHLCGLENEKHKNIRELSKGYRQRVGLAQALIHSPEVIILDELTTGLDPNQTVEIRKLIKSASKEKTIIVSSHVLTEIEATCNRVLILNKGKVVANGKSGDLRKSCTKKTLHLSIEGGNKQEIYDQLSLIKNVNNIETIDNNKISIQVLREENIEKSIFEICCNNNWYIKELTLVEKGLEDIFMQLTQR